VKFLIDMPLSPGLAQWLGEHGHDAVHAAAAGLNRAADTQIITRATAEARTIITADLDYPRRLALAGAFWLLIAAGFADGDCQSLDRRARESSPATISDARQPSTG
jgi:hypothetical protein